MIVVVASYRQNVHAYPSGGGDYEVATDEPRPAFGLLVASALLVDYILTVAVSTAAGWRTSARRSRSSATTRCGSRVGIIVAGRAALNLRGIRESGVAFAIPVYAFIVSMYALIDHRPGPVGAGRRHARRRAPDTSCRPSTR